MNFAPRHSYPHVIGDLIVRGRALHDEGVRSIRAYQHYTDWVSDAYRALTFLPEVHPAHPREWLDLCESPLVQGGAYDNHPATCWVHAQAIALRVEWLQDLLRRLPEVVALSVRPVPAHASE